MVRYILRRLLISVVTVWAIVTVSFFLIRMLPGNPFLVANPLDMTNAEKMMEYYGLNKPLWEQYLIYMGNLLHGDFGYSLKHTGLSVNQAIATYFPVTAQLALQAFCFGLPVGLTLGILAAIRRASVLDYTLNMFTVVMAAIPSYTLAAILQLIFAVKLHWLPVALWNGFEYTILPTILLSLGLISGHCRGMRTLMLEVGKQDYLKTAKAKGLSGARIVVFHQIRNAIMPLLTGLGLELAGMLMGSFIIEGAFSIPGIGAYFVDSITTLDYTMALGLVVFQAILVVFLNLVVDLLYCLVDPRVKIQ